MTACASSLPTCSRNGSIARSAAPRGSRSAAARTLRLESASMYGVIVSAPPEAPCPSQTLTGPLLKLPKGRRSA